MPIINYEDKRVQLEFGHGDIRVSPGLVDGAGAVCFFNKEEGPIGEQVILEEPIEVPAELIPVRMTFDKIASIDVLIRALLDAKRMMIYGQVEGITPMKKVEEK
jgi:hypothetical protein